MRYDAQWERGSKNGELERLVKDTPAGQEHMVDWRAVATELVLRLEVAEIEAADARRDYD